MIMVLDGALTPDELRTWAAAVRKAGEAMRGAHFRTFVDLRTMLPLSPEAASVLEAAKLQAAARPNFQGSAVLVASSVVAMQHRRTSLAGGLMDTELISEDEAACWEHLRRVQRRPGG